MSMGAITSSYPLVNGAASYAIVALIFVHFIFYGTGWGNVPYTLTSEIPSDTLRPRTWAVAGSGAALTGR